MTQLGLIVTITGMGLSDPGTDLAECLAWAVALGFTSATHDIVDGYRVNSSSGESKAQARRPFSWAIASP